MSTFDRPLQTQVRYAARQWQAGDTLPGIVYWSLDPVDNMHDEELTNWLAKLPGARFTVAVGLYRPGDGSRIPAFAPDGQRLKDDTVVLHEVEVTGP